MESLAKARIKKIDGDAIEIAGKEVEELVPAAV